MTHETKETHTPGPWIVKEKKTIGKHIIQVGNEEGWFVCSCDSTNDARLIAAAPELLHVLINAMNALKCSKDQTVLNTSAVRSAELAIRKAKGDA